MLTRLTFIVGQGTPAREEFFSLCVIAFFQCVVIALRLVMDGVDGLYAALLFIVGKVLMVPRNVILKQMGQTHGVVQAAIESHPPLGIVEVCGISDQEDSPHLVLIHHALVDVVDAFDLQLITAECWDQGGQA